MSHTFTTVQWNRNKKVYDLILLAGIVAVFFVEFFVASSATTSKEAPSAEILVLRTLGDTAFILLNLILAVGPLARISQRFLPLLYNRRHMGVTLFVLGLAHGGLALMWYHGFGPVDPLTSLFTSHGSPDIVSEFRFQPLGFFALTIFFLMAATSHDYWNTVLGPVFWKTLHMLVYLAYGLIIAHLSLGALQSAHSALPDWSPWASLVWVGALHIIGAVKSRDARTSAINRDGWLRIDNALDIEPGAGRVITTGQGERIALFRTSNDQFGAISNVCRHQGGPLGEGCLKDDLVTCPWHGFQYRLEDGQSPAPFDEKVETYEMDIIDGQLYLNTVPLPPGTARPLVSLGAAMGEGR